MASLSKLIQQKQELVTHIAQQRTSLTQQVRNLKPIWRVAKFGLAAAGFANGLAALFAVRSIIKKRKQSAERPSTIAPEKKSGFAKFFSGALLLSKVALALVRRRM
jgi:hypothetical protein